VRTGGKKKKKGGASQRLAPGAPQSAAVLVRVKNKPCGRPLKKQPFLTRTARGGLRSVQAGTKERSQPNQGTAKKNKGVPVKAFSVNDGLSKKEAPNN
jgi:hypothetical protein